jgi:hypothetical protein
MSNITAVPYFYDKQIRKYIQQFIRLFAGFQVAVGSDSEGNTVYRTVPVRYGDVSRMVAHIQKQNSENVINTTPFISCYISGLQIDPVSRTYPQYEEKIPVIEKKYNDKSRSYENEQGNIYTLTRHQPVPYKLSMQVDIWTSNTEQKLQLLEQILVLFNPSLNIHTNNNPLDWSTLSVVELTSTQWSNRSIPQGVDDIIDISTLGFELPILINPPAKVQRNSMIHTILTNIHTVPTGTARNIETADDINSLTPLFTSYSIVTLENYKMRFSVDNSGNATAQILNRQGGTTDKNGDPLVWQTLLESFGELRDGISQIRLKQTDDPGDTTLDIVGTLSENTSDASLLNVTLDIDTIPANTQDPITKVIDPEISYPGDSVLPSAALGQRYLLLNSIPGGSAWGGIAADSNDIIEFNGTVWSVTFDASNNTTSTHYTTNLFTLDKLKWTGSQWINAYEGTYNAGFWRLYL